MNINLTLFAQALAFAAFIWFTYRFVWPPLMGAIEARQKQIADGLAASDAGRQSLAKAELKIGDMMTEAKHRSAEIIAQGEKLRTATIEQAKAEAKAEAERILAAAKAEIQQEVARAKESLRDRLGDLVVAGASKILKREVDAKVHADLIAAVRQEL
jgi:F-type H+-transporting ATPase subunit b